MDLKAVAQKPKLIKITLDSEYVLAEYREPLEFFMYDRQSIPTYMRFSQIPQSDTGALIDEIRKLVLTAEGKQMLDDDDELPPNIMLDMINAVVTHLGNSQSQISAT